MNYFLILNANFVETVPTKNKQSAQFLIRPDGQEYFI